MRACYSTLFAFDFDPDVTFDPDEQASCPDPSVDVIENDLARIYSRLKEERVAGGRIDIISHSMGGLAARHFAGATVFPYKTDWDRHQGLYATWMTIDTPHLGSNLASWLVAEAAEGAVGLYPGQPIVTSASEVVWRLSGCTDNELLSDCSADQGHFLSYPGDSTYAKGAVGSLQLGYAGLTNYVSNPYVIPNTLHATIAAYFPVTQSLQQSDPGSGPVIPYVAYDSDASIERAAVEGLIGAILPDPAQDLAGAFISQCSFPSSGGLCLDDVIVPVDSQTNALPYSAAPLPRLAHSGIGAKAIVLEGALLASSYTTATTFSDDNVMSSSSVNQSVLCWLIALQFCSVVAEQPSEFAAASVAVGSRVAGQQQAGFSKNYVIIPPQSDVEKAGASLTAKSKPTPQAKKPSVSHQDVMPGGTVHLENPEGELTLGKQAVIRLTKSGTLPQQVIVSQKVWNSERSVMVAILNSEVVVPVSIDQNGIGRFSVIPLRTGRIQIVAAGFVPNEGVFNESLMASVKDPIDTPFRFFLRGVGDFAHGDRISLSLSPRIAATLNPMMLMNATSKPLRVDHHSVNYKVISGQGSEVISFDPSRGRIRPVGVGHVLIEASYNGAKTYACVVVSADALSSMRSQQQCSDLMPTGMK
jgi:hypothetical protein